MQTMYEFNMMQKQRNFSEQEKYVITNPKEEIYYGYMDKNGNICSMWFKTYDEALKSAESDQPAYLPFYILEKTEHYEIVGKVIKHSI